MGLDWPIIPDHPEWLPDAARFYLDHTAAGLSLRAIERREGVHPSTVMRQVRRYENRRDDPLMDSALTLYSNALDAKDAAMIATRLPAAPAQIEAEAHRILRRLAEPGAVLAFAPEMEKAVVLRELPNGETARIAVVAREIAEAFVLRDWIACRKAGRISTYGVTQAGRLHIRQASGLAEAPAGFDWSGADEDRLPRYGTVETPVAQMGRRRDKDGQPFLSAELVSAAERLREDFELAQMMPGTSQNWDRFLDGGARSTGGAGGFGPAAARDRVATALRDLGPGLGDVVLRVCCYLEGLEQCEKRMGWAARSGKVVLRIGLERLRRHYAEHHGRGPMVG